MYLGNHSVSLGTDPALASHNPAIFSAPSHPGTEKLNKSPRKTKKTLIIPIFSKYFTITLVLSLETHLNSLSLYSSDLTEPNVTKLNINWLSAKTGILHFTKSFLKKKT